MLTVKESIELVVRTVLFLIIMGYFRNFILDYPMRGKRIALDGLIFFIWYGIFLSVG